MNLELNKVSVRYADKLVLHDFSLSLRQGQCVALMGPSGVGKTTILRLLCGLQQPDSGSVTGIPQNGVSVVFQEDRLLAQMTVLDNLKLTAPEQSSENLLLMLDELGLRLEANRFPAQLSGGMKRRVAIARAVAFKREVLLLDEPFTGLDEVSKEQSAQLIRRHAEGRLIVAVTHDVKEAALLGAQIFTIDQHMTGVA